MTDYFSAQILRLIGAYISQTARSLSVNMQISYFSCDAVLQQEKVIRRAKGNSADILGAAVKRTPGLAQICSIFTFKIPLVCLVHFHSQPALQTIQSLVRQ